MMLHNCKIQLTKTNLPKEKPAYCMTASSSKGIMLPLISRMKLYNSVLHMVKLIIRCH